MTQRPHTASSTLCAHYSLPSISKQVHVVVIPLVSEDAHLVQRPYNWGSGSSSGNGVGPESKGTGSSSGSTDTTDAGRGHPSGGGVHDHGPFLTPAAYEAGEGQVAMCTSSPLISGSDRYAAYLPQVGYPKHKFDHCVATPAAVHAVFDALLGFTLLM